MTERPSLHPTPAQTPGPAPSPSAPAARPAPPGAAPRSAPPAQTARAAPAASRHIGDAPTAPAGGWNITRGSQLRDANGKQRIGERILLYGKAGIGKTTLASNMPNPLFIDLQGETSHIDTIARVDLDSWDSLRAAVRDAKLWGQFDTLVIDNLTRAQQLACEWVLTNVPDKGGERRDSLEKFAYGGGPQILADTFRTLLPDLDRLRAAGKHVVLIAHDIVDKVPNPNGENFLRYEPDLYQSGTGKNTTNIRSAVIQWADHVLAVYYDVAVMKDGKARGEGSRTIYPNPLPSHLAKSRVAWEPVPYDLNDPTAIWRAIGCLPSSN